jgi:16S rRNA C967 or C1407 C5-methylase (RsmB/RsmF family)/NOL1/NOP2/fmu family ribosome biogenesis protein
MGRNAQRRSHPSAPTARTDPSFFDRLRTQLGDEVDRLADALLTVSPTSMRVNDAKWNGPALERVPWCASGYHLAERPAFTFDPLLHAGCYYVQEASSMLLEQAVRASGLAGRRIIALDLCAAPGGKSTHLRSLLHSDALLVCNEIDRKRQVVLQENLWKWGASNTVTTGSPPQRIEQLPAFFDLIVVDAPCSGEGMFRKDPFAGEQWSERLVDQCTAMQRDALTPAWESLRPGGVLVYSTCTWEIQENEAQVERLIERGGTCIAIPADPTWGVVRSERFGVDALRCYPHRVKGEGFFIAAVRKPGEWTAHHASTNNGAVDGPVQWLKPTRSWATQEQSDGLFATDATWGRSLKSIQAAMNVLSPGIPLAERKAGEWRPHHALALAQDLDPSHFTRVPLGMDEALAYLRGHALPAAQAQGIALATYHDVALGWLQGAGNRWNNRWPAPWRIRSQHPNAPLVSWSQAH